MNWQEGQTVSANLYTLTLKYIRNLNFNERQEIFSQVEKYRQSLLNQKSYIKSSLIGIRIESSLEYFDNLRESMT